MAHILFQSNVCVYTYVYTYITGPKLWEITEKCQRLWNVKEKVVASRGQIK